MANGNLSNGFHEENVVEDIGNAASTVDQGSEVVQEIESLCMNCHEQGTTRLLLIDIPYFRQLVLMAFECPHCNERNSEVQFAGLLQPLGCRYFLTIEEGDSSALNRQIVKSDSASIKIPEIEFEIPAEAQRGSLNTIEGVLRKAADDLRALQEQRRQVQPEVAQSIDEFLVKLDNLTEAKSKFTVILDDPAGNSFIENPSAPVPDPQLRVENYERTAGQNEAMGFLGAPAEEPSVAGTEPANPNIPLGLREDPVYVPAGTVREPHGSVGASAANRFIAEGNSAEAAANILKYSAPEEVMIFPATCGACGAKGDQRMFVTNIPYFKEVIVMSASCDVCGFRNSELKAGGSISAKGRKSTLKVKCQSDLSRDVIKSDSASVMIPELELELTAGTLGGKVTTVEGLVAEISNSLKRVHGFSLGDSAPSWQKRTWQEFDDKLNKLLRVEEEWTLILDDALDNSFIAPDTPKLEDDERLTFEEYERSWEQNEEWGLNAMSTEQVEETSLTPNRFRLSFLLLSPFLDHPFVSFFSLSNRILN